jgi:hypothetical protein
LDLRVKYGGAIKLTVSLINLVADLVEIILLVPRQCNVEGQTAWRDNFPVPILNPSSMNDRNDNLVSGNCRLDKFVYKEKIAFADCGDGKIVILVMRKRLISFTLFGTK